MTAFADRFFSETEENTLKQQDGISVLIQSGPNMR
jgi:hypothetical protein